MGRAGRAFVLALPCLVLLAIYAPTAHFFANQYDDAYITYRYAIHLAEGHGLVFNIGEHTDAASSFLYTVLLAGAWAFGLRDLEAFGAMVGVVSLYAITYLTWSLALWASNSQRAALTVALAAGLNGLLAGWTLSGMETLPWAALVMAALVSIVRGAAWPWTCLWVSLAVFTRFEGILLLPAWALSALPLHRARALSAAPVRADTGDRAGGSWGAWWAMGAVVLAFGAFYAVKHAYYGVWISHAYAMKEIATYYRAAPLELGRYWLMFSSMAVGLSLMSLRERRLWPAWLFLCLSGVAVAAGPRSDWSRYSAHLIPVVHGLAAVGLVQLSKARWSRLGQGMGLSWAAPLAMVLMLSQAGFATLFNWQHMTVGALHQVCRKAMGEHIRRHISPDEPVASSDLGAVSYVAIDHRFVDLVALTSADVLGNYQQGRNADGVLRSHHVRYIADTVSSRFDDRVNELRELFPRVHQPSRYAVMAPHGEGAPSAGFDCEAGPIGFRVAELVDQGRPQAIDMER